MKKELYFILILLLGIIVNCNSKPTKPKHSESHEKHSNVEEAPSNVLQNNIVDSIDIDNLVIKKTGTSSIRLGDSIQSIVNAFGQPDSTYSYYFEMDEKTAIVYVYNGSKFYFLDAKLDSYTISSNVFSIGNANTNAYFSLGNHISSLSPLFPNYFANKKLNRTYANLSHNGHLYDMFILISYNPNTENITEVSIRTY